CLSAISAPGTLLQRPGGFSSSGLVPDCVLRVRAPLRHLSSPALSWRMDCPQCLSVLSSGQGATVPGKASKTSLSSSACAILSGPQGRLRTMIERQRRTKILATLGPATDAPGVLDDLFRAGVNVVRLNFSHGDPSGQAKRAADVRAAAQRVGVEVGILADLPGPKIRIERFAEGKVQLKAGDRFDLVASVDAPAGDASQVGVSYLGLPQDVAPGDVLLLDDGLMQLRVVEVQGERIINTVLNDGVLSDRKGLNKQGGGLSLGALTERDKELIGIV